MLRHPLTLLSLSILFLFVLPGCVAQYPTLVTPASPTIVKAGSLAQSITATPTIVVDTATATATTTRTTTPENTTTATVTRTPRPSDTPTRPATATPSSTIQVTGSAAFPYKWPMPALTTKQLDEVRGCQAQDLPKSRYPDKLKVDELEQAFKPQTPCDWFMLAYAFAIRSGYQPPSKPEQEAFTRALAVNPAYAVPEMMFSRYDGLELVQPPPIARRSILSAQIHYTWRGMGNQVGYEVEIKQANQRPVVSGAGTHTTVDPAQVQAFASSLGNLVPVDELFQSLTCADNYPDWTVKLQFDDGTNLDIATHGSNYWSFGGPWQVKIGEQNYVQVSTEFVKAVYDLTRELELPIGQPAAMACHSVDLVKLAFPKR